MSLSKIISLVIKLVWCLTFILVVTIDRENKLMSIITIVFLILISLTTILRSINSRNEWREMIEEGEVEIKDKISFD